MDPELADWQQALLAEEPSLRWQAAEALGLLGQSNPRAVVAALSRAVHDPDLDVRLQAVASLTTLQAKAENAVPALEKSLEDRDSDLRRQVVLALNSIGPFAEEASPTLAQLLRDPNTNVRLSAVKALQTIGSDAVAALDNLADTLKDKVPSVRRAGAEALGQIGADYPTRTGKTVRALAEALKDRDPEVCRQSARALGALGASAGAAVEELGQASRTGSDTLREEAAVALGRIGVQALPQLQQNLRSEKADVRRLAADYLQMLRYQARPAFAALCQALADSVPAVSTAVIRTLRVLDPEPKDILPVLASVRTSANSELRQLAVNWLGEIALGMDRPLAHQAITHLLPALEDAKDTIRYQAAIALGAAGVEARAAVPALLNLLKDADRSVRLQAAMALGKIAPADANKAVPELIQALPVVGGSRRADPLPYSVAVVTVLAAIGAVEPLIEALEHKSEGISAGATAALVLMGKKAHGAIPTLRQALHDRNPVVRQRAASALQALAPDPEVALPLLLEECRHEDEAIRQWAAAFLGAIARRGDLTPKAREALIPLTALTADQSTAVRESAATALGNIVEQLRRTPDALPNEADLVRALTACLQSTHASERSQAALALGKIGAARRGQGPIQQAIPALLALLKDGQPFQREAATVLGQIGVVDPLVQALTDADQKVRAGAACALGLVGQEASAAVPALQSVLQKDKDCYAQEQAALALGEIGRLAAASVPELVAAMSDSHALEHAAPLRALAILGPEADTAAPALVPLLSNPSSSIRQYAVEALAASGAGAVPALSAALASELMDTVELSAQALQRIGTRARASVSALVRAFTAPATKAAVTGVSSVEAMRLATARALGAILSSVTDAEVVPALTLALEGPTSWYEKQHIADLLYAAAEGPPADALRRFAPVVRALAAQVGTRDWGYDEPPEDLRRRCAQTLGRLGPAARTSIPSLLDELDRQFVQPIPVSRDDQSPPVLFEVARALRAIIAPKVPASQLVGPLREAGLDERQTALVLGVADDQAVPPLLERLRHRNARVRQASVRALGQLVAATREVRDALVQASGDLQRQIRLSSLDALSVQGNSSEGGVGEVGAGLEKATEHWDAQTRVRASLRRAELEREVQQVPRDDRAFKLATEILVEALERRPLGAEKVRQFVTQMDRFQHVFALLTSPPMRSDNPDPSIRRHVLDVLGQANLWHVKNPLTDQERASVQDGLQGALSDRKADVRHQAARALGQLGPWVRGSVADLQILLHDREAAVREAAAVALWKIAQQTADVLPLLVETLGREGYYPAGLIERVRRGEGSWVLETLAEMDTLAEAALLRALTAEQTELRVGAVVALGSRPTRTPATVGRALTAALADTTALVRLHAAEALRFQGASEQEFVAPLLATIKEDPDSGVRLAALTTLGVLGPQATSEPDSYLLALLTDSQESMRAEAMKTLGRWGERAAMAMPALQRALKDRSQMVREWVVQTLADIGVPALPALREALKDKDPDLRKEVVLALRRLGPTARPALEEALQDRDEEVRAAAVAALKQ